MAGQQFRTREWGDQRPGLWSQPFPHGERAEPVRPASGRPGFRAHRPYPAEDFGRATLGPGGVTVESTGGAADLVVAGLFALGAILATWR